MAKWKGQQSLNRKLRRLGPVVKDEVFKGLEQAAALLERRTRNFVPVDQGDLKAALHHKTFKSMKARVGWWKKGNLKKWRQAGWRAHFIEGGTRGGTIKTGPFAGRKIPPQAAHPMLAPAFRVSLRRIAKIIDTHVDRGIDKVVRGL